MNKLTIIKMNGGAYIDSREVAAAIEKPHNDLMKCIRKYGDYLIAGKISLNDFFVESSYVDSIGRTLPCYLISKMGCELVANKLTGEKGVLFTAAYVTKFNEMEQCERAELEKLAAMPKPHLGEINACARIVVEDLKNIGTTSEKIIDFLKGIYEPFGITIADDTNSENAMPMWYTAQEIAEKCGIYSHGGNPHSKAVSCILNENIFISDNHTRSISTKYGDYLGSGVQYDRYALYEVIKWLVDNDMPDEIYGFDRTYHIQYRMATI